MRKRLNPPCFGLVLFFVGRKFFLVATFSLLRAVVVEAGCLRQGGATVVVQERVASAFARAGVVRSLERKRRVCSLCESST